MYYYEVLPADARYRGGPLTYSFDEKISDLSVVSISLRGRKVTGFCSREVPKPDFEVKPILSAASRQPLPAYLMALAEWLAEYYAVSLGECLAQFAPTRPALRRSKEDFNLAVNYANKLLLDLPLTAQQKKALSQITQSPQTTVVLHGQTGSGKTRMYLELAKETLGGGRSVILLTPEISLTTQLQNAAAVLGCPVFIFHSQLSAAQRKKIWFSILEQDGPCLVIGPRSALFTPLHSPGLIVLDEAHEPAYKQSSSIRYQTSRVASAMGKLTGAKVILGTATPAVTDYFIAGRHNAIVKMDQPALVSRHPPAKVTLVDLRDRANLPASPFISRQLSEALSGALAGGKQSLVYLNRRGSARLALCKKCGWQALCPNCDIPLVYHGDRHDLACHTCGFSKSPPTVCPECANPDIIYRGIGTKALAGELGKLFPSARIARFDSDNPPGQRLHERYGDIFSGKIDIITGTQLLAKGLDLPKLQVAGVISADSSLAMPDFSSEERSFQLLYQVIGRVGRGHGQGEIVIQTYQPDSPAVRFAAAKDYDSFYQYALGERQKYNFPPFVYLLKLTCQRASLAGAKQAAEKLHTKIAQLKLPVELIGPAPSFWGKRAGKYRWQIAVKSRNRTRLLEIASQVPSGWTVDLDPTNLL